MNLDAFVSRLNPLAPGCPDPVAKQALVDSAIAFCSETDVVQVYSRAGVLRAGEANYDLDLPASTDLARVLRVWVDSLPVTLGTRPMMYDRSAWESARTGRPSWACSVERNTITLVPAPGERDAGKGLYTLVSTRPSLDAKEVADALYYDWADAVVMGAVSRLAAYPGTTFTSVDMAVYASAMYRAEVGKAHLERSYGQVMGETRVVGRPFGGRR